MKLRLLKSDRRKFTVLDDVSGIIPPSRICLLLGPPGSGKSTLLKALAGKMQNDPTVRVRLMCTAFCFCNLLVSSSSGTRFLEQWPTSQQAGRPSNLILSGNMECPICAVDWFHC